VVQQEIQREFIETKVVLVLVYDFLWSMASGLKMIRSCLLQATLDG